MNPWRSFKCGLLALALVLPYSLEAKVTVKEILNNEQQQAKDSSEHAEQSTLPGNEVATNEHPIIDEFNRQTPRSAMQGYLHAAHQRDFERAAHYLDFRNLSLQAQAMNHAELAHTLYLVLNRTLWVDTQALSNHPAGSRNEPVPSYRDLVGEIDTSRGAVQILLQRVPGDTSGNYIWKVSNATVNQVPFLRQEFGYSQAGEWLYRHLPHGAFLGVELWQWVYYSLNLLAFLLIAYLSTRIFLYLLLRAKADVSQPAKALVTGPLCFLLGIVLARTFSSEANSTLATRAIFEGATLLILAWTWFLLKVVDVIRLRLTLRLQRNNNTQAEFLLRPAGNVVKILLTLIALLVWFENLGFSATTLIAGLGIGGLALALAAQKSVENIIGAITLYASAPVKVGQVCRVGRYFGVVEEIGLRATRMRTLERSVIHIANAKFVDMEIENISERERIAYRPDIVLERSTQHQVLAQLLEQIREILEQHQDIADQPCRVRLSGFVPRGIKIDVLSYAQTTDFDYYLHIVESLNLQIIECLNRLGIALAAPEPLSFAKL